MKTLIITPEAETLLNSIAVAVNNPKGDPIAQVECVRAMLALYDIRPGAFEIKEPSNER